MKYRCWSQDIGEHLDYEDGRDHCAVDSIEAAEEYAAKCWRDSYDYPIWPREVIVFVAVAAPGAPPRDVKIISVARKLAPKFTGRVVK